jgi:glyoxylase I family protein
MEILGLVFAGSATDRRPAMASFAREVLGLEPATLEAVDADLFALPRARRQALRARAGPLTVRRLD